MENQLHQIISKKIWKKLIFKFISYKNYIILKYNVSLKLLNFYPNLSLQIIIIKIKIIIHKISNYNYIDLLF